MGREGRKIWKDLGAGMNTIKIYSKIVKNNKIIIIIIKRRLLAFIAKCL